MYIRTLTTGIFLKCVVITLHIGGCFSISDYVHVRMLRIVSGGDTDHLLSHNN